MPWNPQTRLTFLTGWTVRSSTSSPAPSPGAARGTRRRAATFEITPGSVFCFYTDGLIERRGQLIDQGMAGLCQLVSAEPPEAACVMSALVGNEAATDDVTVLMIRCQPSAV
jgi:phosphoserine phosphatase RsbU/P